MLIDDIKKANLLGISYGEYMALKKDFYSADEEKALRATVRMAELMQKASIKLKGSEENDLRGDSNIWYNTNDSSNRKRGK